MKDKDIINIEREQKKLIIPVQKDIIVQFVIKLEHEEIAIKHFFDCLINGFITGDQRICSYLDDNMDKTRARFKRRMLKKEREQMKETENKFGLNKQEIEDMYDFFEEEEDI